MLVILEQCWCCHFPFKSFQIFIEKVNLEIKKEKNITNDVGVNLEFVGETYEIMEGVMFEKGTKSWLPTDIWEGIKHKMTDWKVI